MKIKFILPVLALTLLTLSACSSKNEPTKEETEKTPTATEQTQLIEGFKEYKNAANGFSLMYPSEWEMRENLMGAVVAFLTKRQSDTDFQENVNIIVQDLKTMPMTLKEYTDLSLKQIQSFFTDVKILENKEIKWADNEAQMLVYTGKQGAYNLKWMQVWSVIDNKAYVFTYTANEPNYNDFIEMTNKMVDSFQLK